MQPNSVGDEGARALGEGLRGNAALQQLNLELNSVGDESAQALRLALQGTGCELVL